MQINKWNTKRNVRKSGKKNWIKSHRITTPTVHNTQDLQSASHRSEPTDNSRVLDASRSEITQLLTQDIITIGIHRDEYERKRTVNKVASENKQQN